jgi:hypothetical protein
MPPDPPERHMTHMPLAGAKCAPPPFRGVPTPLPNALCCIPYTQIKSKPAHLFPPDNQGLITSWVFVTGDVGKLFNLASGFKHLP